MNGTEASQANGPAQEYLTFTLGREEYAIDILRSPRSPTRRPSSRA